jgi:hypothetical protein
MTKGIKIFLIAIGFIVSITIILLVKTNSSEGRLFEIILMMVYLAYARAIWKYEKKSDNENKLDKTIK